MQRRSMETRYVEDGIAREDTYSRELYDMQAADAENYQKLKVKLETDVAILEQQLEHMKVRAMLIRIFLVSFTDQAPLFAFPVHIFAQHGKA